MPTKNQRRNPRAIATLVLLLAAFANSAFSQDATSSDDSLATAKELEDQADKLFKAGQYAKAVPLGERAVSIREKLQGGEHADTAASVNSLGVYYRAAGDFTRAEATLLRGLAIRQKILSEGHPDIARSLNNLGGLYYFSGDFGRAGTYYKRALAIREKTLGPDHIDTAGSLNNLAIIYVETGAYSLAEPLYKRALAIKEKTLGPEHPSTTSTINNLANLYRELGDLPAAETLGKRVIDTYERTIGKDHPDTGGAINNLAILYRLTGAYAQAELLYKRAIEIKEKALGAEHPDTLSSMNNLAELYTHIGAHDRAEPIFQRVLSVRERILGPDSPDIAKSLNNLAELYREMGEYSKARPLIERALVMGEKSLGLDHPEVARFVSNYAQLSFATGDLEFADSQFKRALAMRDNALGSEHPSTVQSKLDLAVIEWRTGHLDRSLELMRDAQASQLRNMEHFLVSGSESRKRAYLQALSNDTFKYVSLALEIKNKKAIALGLNGVLQYKGRVLDAMSDSIARLRTTLKPDARETLERLAQTASEYSALVYQGANGTTRTDYRKRLSEIALSQEKLEAELAQRSEEFRHHIAAVDVATVEKATPVDAAFLEWFRYRPYHPRTATTTQDGSIAESDRYVVYVIRRNVDPVMVDIGDAASIDRLLQEYRIALAQIRDDNLKAVSASLSNAIVKPLWSYIRNANHLIISPDSALTLVPFAPLIDDKNEVLAKRFQITYLTSGRDLLRLERKSAAREDAVVVADPDFGPVAFQSSILAAVPTGERSPDLDRSGMLFRPLANTALEAQALQDLLKLEGTRMLLHDRALETTVKQLHGPRILHLASHGFFLTNQQLADELRKRTSVEQQMTPAGENPLLRSGIALAGANARHSGESDDGILTALEVAQLDLQGTELVVLSACDSGLGDVQNGEGVYGLRRAIVLAGAQTQVTSLWKVSDEATRKLMVNFYQRLLKGEGRSEALRHAQLDMLATAEYSHPYYWASFIPIGNWKPLPKPH